MSYCRFSSDNFKCEVYCYEGIDGFHVIIARKKFKDIKNAPHVDYINDYNIDEVLIQHKNFNDWMETAEEVDIGLPEDGEHYVFGDVHQAYEKMKQLKEMGYYIPVYTMEILKEDAEEWLNNE